MESSKLNHRKRYECPACGAKRGLAREKNNENQGYCFACRTLFKAEKPTPKMHEKMEIPEYSKTISPALVEATLKHYELNNLYQFLHFTFFGDYLEQGEYNNTLHTLFLKYKVGTARDGSCLFWQHDINGNARKFKKMQYDRITGRRTGEPINPTEYKNDTGYFDCFFGEHLIHQCSEMPIAIVESEKTALIMNLSPANVFLFIASGGSNGITKRKLLPLMRRKVVLIPDNDKPGREGYKRAAELLKSHFIDVKFVDGRPALNDGSDVADLYLSSFRSPKQPPPEIEKSPEKIKQKPEQTTPAKSFEEQYDEEMQAIYNEIIAPHFEERFENLAISPAFEFLQKKFNLEVPKYHEL